MSVMRKSANEGRYGYIKAWLFSEGRSQKKPTFRPELESLEGRAVPSATGLDPAQFQAGLHYLGQVVQQQVTILQKDMNLLIQDVQQGESARIGSDVQRLQTDFGAQSQAITAAIDAVLSGHIPSSIPPVATAHSSPTQPTTSRPTTSPSSHSSEEMSSVQSSEGRSSASGDEGLLSRLYSQLPPDQQIGAFGTGRGSGTFDSGIASNDQSLWTLTNQLNATLAWGLGDQYSGELVAYSPIDDGSSALGADYLQAEG